MKKQRAIASVSAPRISVSAFGSCRLRSAIREAYPNSLREDPLPKLCGRCTVRVFATRGNPMKEVLTVVVVRKKRGCSKASTSTIAIVRKPNAPVNSSKTDRARARKEFEKLFVQR